VDGFVYILLCRNLTTSGCKPIGSSVDMCSVFKSKRFLRPLIGVVIAYAVAVQGLLIALGGFPPVAQGRDGAPGFELCLHDSQDTPAQSPASKPDQSGYTHCLYCFAGAYQAVIGATPTAFHRIEIGLAAAPASGSESARPRASPHSIANPRGPPRAA
jgi:hypothetical protein